MNRELKVYAAGLTNVGKVRSSNQDSLLIDQEKNLYIVADGMGGHAGGEIASTLCVETVAKYLNENFRFREEDAFDRTKEREIFEVMVKAVNYTSAKIYEHALENPELKGMGTTATIIKILGNRAFCAHVGDSRFYLSRSGFLYQITFDHSLVSEQVRAGLLSPEEAEQHHLKNVITRSVGYQEEEDVDTMAVTLQPCDCLVISSDGLHGKVSDKEISKIIKESGINSIHQLVELANERGGEDNITVIILSAQE